MEKLETEWAKSWPERWLLERNMDVCTCVFNCSVVSESLTPWTAAHQAPLSMGFSRQEHWSGWPCPPPGDLPNPGIEPRSPHCRQILYRLSHQGGPERNISGSYSRIRISCQAKLFVCVSACVRERPTTWKVSLPTRWVGRQAGKQWERKDISGTRDKLCKTRLDNIGGCA